MALIRGHHDFDDHFTQIPNDWLRDDRLTLEARGLLAQMMSHRPGWNVSINSMAKRNNIGRDKARRIIDELLNVGYLERSEKQQHDEKGRLAGYDYITRDPQGLTQKPYKAEPHKAEPDKVSSPPKNTIPKNNKLEKTIDIEIVFQEFWSIYPKKADKPVAKRAFEKALKRTTAEVILNGAQSYRDDPNREQRFTKNPASWLNADAWENEPLPSKEKLANWQRAVLLSQKYAEEAQNEVEQVNRKVVRELEAETTSWLKGVDDE